MKLRVRARLIVATIVGVSPIFSFAACGGDDVGLVIEDAAVTDDMEIDTSAPDDAVAPEDASLDASKKDARATDAGVTDAAKVANRCGGYEALLLGGNLVTPGDSCGTCGDGTVACIGSDTVTCAGASSPPCPTPPVDAGPNACGGYGPVTFLSQDASAGDSCECGQLECASPTSLACLSGGYCGDIDAGVQTMCNIPSGAYTATPPAPTLPAETRPTTTTRSSIALPASDLAYNPYDGFLYASIIQGVSQGNSIAKIDPTSTTVLKTIYVGPSPSQIALSDDGKALWVVFGGGSPNVRRVDLTTFTAGASFAVGANANISSVQVLAGTEDSLAVSSLQSGAFSTLIYDNGIARSYGVSLWNWTERITTASSSLIFADYAYPGQQIVTICVDGDGAFAKGYAEPPSNNYSYGKSVFYGGVLYNPDGSSYDAQTGALLHTFDVGYLNSLIAVDTNDVYYLTLSDASGGGYWTQVTGFDRTTYASTKTDLLATNVWSPTAFTRWGRYGFAYLNNSTSIEIARSTIIPDMP